MSERLGLPPFIPDYYNAQYDLSLIEPTGKKIAAFQAQEKQTFVT